MSHRLTKDERAVIRSLVDAWNAYMELPRSVSHHVVDDATTDFRKAIHDAQRIVFARPAIRAENKRR